MAAWTGGIDTDTSSGSRQVVAGGLLPILYALRAVGTDLDVGQPRSKPRRCAFALSAMLMLVLVVWANAKLTSATRIMTISATLYDWSTALKNVTRLVASALFHSAFVSMSLFHWQTLWSRARTLERFMHFPPDFPARLRRFSSVTFTLIMAVVRGTRGNRSENLQRRQVSLQEAADKIIGGMYGFRLKKLKRGGFDAVEVVGIVLGELHECFMVALFVSLTWFASESIATVTDDVRKRCRIFRSDGRGQLLRWQQSHCLILNLVEEVDSVFGRPLLVFIFKQNILFIAYLSLIIDLIAREESFPVFSLCFSIRNTFLILVLIIASQRMKIKVSRLHVSWVQKKTKKTPNSSERNPDRINQMIISRPPLWLKR